MTAGVMAPAVMMITVVIAGAADPHRDGIGVGGRHGEDQAQQGGGGNEQSFHVKPPTLQGPFDMAFVGCWRGRPSGTRE
jgi:hypothetical protein